MPARILVVDDNEANLKLATARLEADYFEVLTASTGEQALELAVAELPDIILLDVMMPGIGGYETCRRLKKAPETRHIPVIIITALDGREDRLSGLEAGADDFLTKPIDEVLLLARVKALVRLKVLIDELRQREALSRRAGLIDQTVFKQTLNAMGNVLVLDDNEVSAARLIAELGVDYRAAFETQGERALKIAAGRVDLVVLNMAAKNFDPLRWVAKLRSDEATRNRPVLGLIAPGDRKTLLRGLELGINDFLFKPLDYMELMARARTQIRRKRYGDFLRQSLDRSLEMALIDPLTGLNNRRFMTSQLTHLLYGFARDVRKGGAAGLSLLMIDIDHFKRINDRFGHDGGDQVLRQFAQRLSANIRAIDMACRFGGEEFVVLMPDTQLADALQIAERVRSQVSAAHFDLGAPGVLEVTASIGVATAQEGDSMDSLLKRADEAVYEAKSSGRNRVITRAA
jgi:two-component system, cell cycle response regulator